MIDIRCNVIKESYGNVRIIKDLLVVDGIDPPHNTKYEFMANYNNTGWYTIAYNEEYFRKFLKIKKWLEVNPMPKSDFYPSPLCLIVNSKLYFEENKEFTKWRDKLFTLLFEIRCIF